MEASTLILSYVDALVWPAVVFIGILIFKSEIRGLIRSLERLRLPGGTELNWTGKLSIMSPEEQRDRIKKEIELTKSDGDGQTRLADETELHDRLERGISEAYLAEDLVMRAIEGESDQPVSRNVMYSNRPDFAFDGLALLDRKPTLIEVKYVTEPERVDMVFDRFVEYAKNLKMFDPSVNADMLLVIVTDGLNDSELSNVEKSIKDRRKFKPYYIKYRVYDFKKLKKLFGVESNG